MMGQFFEDPRTVRILIRTCIFLSQGLAFSNRDKFRIDLDSKHKVAKFTEMVKRYLFLENAFPSDNEISKNTLLFACRAVGVLTEADQHRYTAEGEEQKVW